IAQTNQCWFCAYTFAYPKLTRTFQYRGDDPRPPNWRKKLETSYRVTKSWKWFGELVDGKREWIGNISNTTSSNGKISTILPRSLSMISPAVTTATTTSITDGLSKLQITSSTPATPSLASPLQQQQQQQQFKSWSHLLSRSEIHAHTSLLHYPDFLVPQDLAISTIVPETQMEIKNAMFASSYGNLSGSPKISPWTGKYGTDHGSLIAVSAVHRLIPARNGGDIANVTTGAGDPNTLRTTVLFYSFSVVTSSLVLEGGVTFGVQPSNDAPLGWNWLTLRHVDSQTDVFAMIEEDEEAGRWNRVILRRLSAAKWNTVVKATGTPMVPSCLPSPYHRQPCSATDTDHLIDYVVPEEFIGYSLTRCPKYLTHLPKHGFATRLAARDDMNILSRKQLLPIDSVGVTILLGVTENQSAMNDDDQIGTLLFLQHRSGNGGAMLLGRANYGTNVSAIEIGDPYEPVVITGHLDHGVKLWDLSTGELLISVLGGGGVGNMGSGAMAEFGSSNPALGFAWLDEPEAWLAHTGTGSGGSSLSSSNGTGKSGELAWSKPRASTLVSFSDMEFNDATNCGGGEFAVWDLGKISGKKTNEVASLVKAPSKSTSPTTKLKIPVSEEDAVATFTVMHPLLVLVTVLGNIKVVSIETGEVLVTLTRERSEPECDDGEDDDEAGLSEEEKKRRKAMMLPAAGGVGVDEMFKSPGITRCPITGNVLVMTSAGLIMLNVPK
ncbi:hypothetical protein HDU76_008491, partial [Blyttiomyces sp. JEL0837]